MKREKEKVNDIQRKRKIKKVNQKVAKPIRLTAVNHSPRPNRDKHKSPIKINTLNSTATKIGPKIGGGPKDMPPQTRPNGENMMAGHISTDG